MRNSWAADRASFARLTDGAGIRHQPGLDGLRGLAVAAVVLFHTGLGWLPGGYLGVSLFFTISGTVIGTVILHEIERHGAFSLRAFWIRRGRRLLPAAWVVLAVIAGARITSTVFVSTSAGDVLAAWLQVANWHVIAADQSYGSLFTGPSAVLHFWSLAIEEQFYVLVGLGALLLGRLGRRAAPTLGTIAVAVGVVSFALPFVFTMSVDRVYYGTDTRAGELLVGLALAAVVADGRRRAVLLRWSRPVAVVGVVAAVVTLVMWCTLEAGTDGLRRGLLPLTAVLSTAIVLAAMLPGPIRMLAGLPPLRWLGDLSYGLYLIHWPVFVALRHVTPAPSVLAFAVATGISVALAWLSAQLIELPVRRRRVDRQLMTVGVGGLAAAMAIALVVPAQTLASQDLLDRITAAAAAPPTTTATIPTTTMAGAPAGAPASGNPLPARPHVELLGDSIAFSLSLSLGQTVDQAQFDGGPGEFEIGCGVGPNVLAAGSDGAPCAGLTDRLAAAAATRQIDVAVVASCQWELVSQRLPGESAKRSPGDPVFDDYVLAKYTTTVQTLRAAGISRVFWIRCPRMSQTVRPAGLSAELLASRDPARMAAIDKVVDRLAAEDGVEVLDLASWVQPRLDDAVLRPDGAHFAWDVDTGVAAELTGLINAALAR